MTGTIREKKSVGDDGEWVVELQYFIDREQVTEAAYREQFPEQDGVPMFGNTSSAWPLRSEAMAVHSSQIEKVKERNKKHGLNIPYDKMGRPILADQGQRKALMKVEGYKQMNSFYGA